MISTLSSDTAFNHLSWDGDGNIWYMKGGKKCFDTDLTWGTSTRRENAIRWWYIEVFAVKIVRDELMQSIINIHKELVWKLQPWGMNWARGLIPSLDAHVTQGGLCCRVLGVKTKGEDCVKCPDPMYLMR